MANSRSISPILRGTDFSVDSEGYTVLKNLSQIGPVWFSIEGGGSPPTIPIMVLGTGEILGAVAHLREPQGLRDIVGGMTLNGNPIGPEMRIIEGGPVDTAVEFTTPIPFNKNDKLSGFFFGDGPSPTENVVTLHFFVRWSSLAT